LPSVLEHLVKETLAHLPCPPPAGVGKFDSDIFDGLDKLYPGGPFDVSWAAGRAVPHT